MSTGGWKQPEWSPCRCVLDIEQDGYLFLLLSVRLLFGFQFWFGLLGSRFCWDCYFWIWRLTGPDELLVFRGTLLLLGTSLVLISTPLEYSNADC